MALQPLLIEPRMHDLGDGIEPRRVQTCGTAARDGELHPWRNFVPPRRERIAHAMPDWLQGRFDRIPGGCGSIRLPGR